jgi:hypothetical protein
MNGMKGRQRRFTRGAQGAGAWALGASGIVFTAVACSDANSSAVETSRSALALAETLTLEAEADTLVRTDLDVRRNDNYGCEGGLMVGTGRGGGGIPWGGADAMRSFVRFAMPAVTAPSVLHADLELTIASFNRGTGASVFTLDVHRVLDAPPLTPWVEGNGTTQSPAPSGCTNVDLAGGMAWEASEPENQTQPPFDSSVVASATVTQGVQGQGDVVRLDVTPLVRGWLSGAFANHGLALRDPTTDGSFRELYLASRERGAPLFGPRLVLTIAPTYKCVGFGAPMNGSALVVRGPRSIPLKASLFDSEGLPVTNTTVAAAPRVTITHMPAGGGAPVDVSDRASANGNGRDGLAFAYTLDARWQYNLDTAAFTAPGEYRVTLVSGDAGEYLVAPVCTGTFVVR